MRWIVALAPSLIAACTQQPATYSPDYERNFVTACEAQGSSNALCSCTWDRIEAEISPGDFTALERMPGPQRDAHPLTAQINGYVEACNVSLGALPAPGAETAVPAP